MLNIQRNTFRKRMVHRSESRRSVASVFVFTIFVLQVVTALLSAQTMASQWSELTVTWPYEITFCSCEFLVVILVKISQLYMANISSRVKKERYLWLTILLALPCILLLCCGLLACRLVKVRVYNKLVWNMSQEQRAVDSTNGHRARNATIPYVDTYQVISMTSYDTKEYVKTAWDIVQQKYQCCGSNAAQDWTLVRIVLPTSCCIDPASLCSRETAFQAGCAPKVNEILFEQLRSLEVTVFILMIFECLMIVFVFVTILGNQLLRIVKNVQAIPNKTINNQILKDDDYFLPVNTISGRTMVNGGSLLLT